SPILETPSEAFSLGVRGSHAVRARAMPTRGINNKVLFKNLSNGFDFFIPHSYRNVCANPRIKSQATGHDDLIKLFLQRGTWYPSEFLDHFASRTMRFARFQL